MLQNRFLYSIFFYPKNYIYIFTIVKSGLPFVSEIAENSCMFCIFTSTHVWNIKINEFAKSRAIRACVPKACQLLIRTCQRAIRRANDFTWRENVPNAVTIFQLGVPTCQKACQFFKHSSYEMLIEISILYYYIENSTFYFIS